MKRIILVVAFLISSQVTYSQSDNPAYDKALADSLGGDDYGMKSYVLVILKTGSNSTDNKQLIDSLFRGHMDNIGRLADAGKLIVAGPLKKMKKPIEAFLYST